MTRAPRVAILGGGIAGLTAAVELRRLGCEPIVFEAGKQLAGLAATRKDPDGFSYDTGAHFITNRLAAAIGVGHECRVVERYGESVWYGGRVLSYPMGLLTVPRFVASAATQTLRNLGRRPHNDSAADAFRNDYGAALTDAVAAPLLEAWSGAPAAELSTAVAEKLPTSIPQTVFLRAAARLTRRAVAIGYGREKPQSAHVWHVYPVGGVARLCHALASEVGDAVHLETPVERIEVVGNRAVGVRAGGHVVEADAVISTAPANILPRLAPDAPALARFAPLRFRPMVFVNLRMRGRALLPNVVLWTPDRSLPFFRLTEASQSMPWLAPPGHTVILCDIGATPDDPVWTADEADLGRQCIEALRQIIPDARERYLGAVVQKTTIAYPIFLRSYEPARKQLETSTGVDRLLSLGRNGEFGHWLMEDVYWRTMGKVRTLADELRRAAP